MPRKILASFDSGGPITLQETLASDEFQLQELIKKTPDLLPIEDFEMTGPLLVIGRETTLPSGAVDLVALARSGELLIIEFKTGPQNTDFRRALSQLVDYGSHLWALSFDAFEAAVPVQYFNDKVHCTNQQVMGLKSLAAAARTIWRDISDEEFSVIKDRVSKQLADGSFHYLLVAQRFTSTIGRTAEYLNASMPRARFYAVELVRFHGGSVEAFEARTVLKPPTGGSGEKVDEDKLLARFAAPQFREFIARFLDTSRAQGYVFRWGTTGVSIRVPSVDQKDPLSVAWVFPPDGSGWMSLRNLTLGYDKWSADRNPSIRLFVDDFLRQVKELPGAETPRGGIGETARSFSPSVSADTQDTIIDLITNLMANVTGVSAGAETTAP